MPFHCSEPYREHDDYTGFGLFLAGSVRVLLYRANGDYIGLSAAMRV